MEIYKFKLYVAGNTDLAQRAFVNLSNACQILLYDRHTIEVIDILRDPRIARENRIIATPMLVKYAPDPEVKIVGDLGDMETFALNLGLGYPKYEGDDGPSE
ncbi:MAG: circadian clock KaiB family protein [Gemmataceae bacterium]